MPKGLRSAKNTRDLDIIGTKLFSAEAAVKDAMPRHIDPAEVKPVGGDHGLYVEDDSLSGAEEEKHI